MVNGRTCLLSPCFLTMFSWSRGELARSMVIRVLSSEAPKFSSPHRAFFSCDAQSFMIPRSPLCRYTHCTQKFFKRAHGPPFDIPQTNFQLGPETHYVFHLADLSFKQVALNIQGFILALHLQDIKSFSCAFQSLVLALIFHGKDDRSLFRTLFKFVLSFKRPCLLLLPIGFDLTGRAPLRSQPEALSRRVCLDRALALNLFPATTQPGSRLFRDLAPSSPSILEVILLLYWLETPSFWRQILDEYRKFYISH